jgi:hypothetical protein
LIDVAILVVKFKVGDAFFKKYAEVEKEELQEFSQYFLNR